MNRRMTIPETRWSDAVRAAGWLCMALAAAGLLVSMMLSAGLLAARSAEVSLANEGEAWTSTAMLLIGGVALAGAAIAMFVTSDRMSRN